LVVTSTGKTKQVQLFHFNSSRAQGTQENFAFGVGNENRHLVSHLSLPCEVTGIEDFQWEEFYVIGPGDKAEYDRLRRNRPSYRDVFQLMAIDCSGDSKWCLVADELKANVCRKSDGKRFVLGLSELKATERDSKNYQLLHDYAVWLVNYR
jgi:hypothetical protein